MRSDPGFRYDPIKQIVECTCTLGLGTGEMIVKLVPPGIGLPFLISHKPDDGPLLTVLGVVFRIYAVSVFRNHLRDLDALEDGQEYPTTYAVYGREEDFSHVTEILQGFNNPQIRRHKSGSK